MLARLTKRFRLRAAMALAALYVICLLGPHAARALGSANGAHCLTDNFVAAHVHKTDAPSSHVHAKGETHHHDGASHHHTGDGQLPLKDDGGKNRSGTCCGLFCVTAMTTDGVVILAPSRTSSTNPPGFGDSLAGRGPVLINRPPIG
jgi:hypothetical protein